jgi:ATP-dependent Clp protease ATP-binding subunit ClpA
MNSLRKICRQFVDLELAKIRRDYGYDAKVSEAAFELMLRLGTDLVLGARPTRTAVAKLLGDAVTTAQLKGLPKGQCAFERHLQGEFLLLLVKEPVQTSK